MTSTAPPLQPTPDQTAGLLLVARRFAEAHGLPGSSVDLGFAMYKIGELARAD